jgi:hypothetical protein
MGAIRSMSKDKSMDASSSNSRADNSRNTCNSMDASNIMDKARAWTPLTGGTTEETPSFKLLKLESCI